MIEKIEIIQSWLYQIMFWSSGVVFVYPFEKKKHFNRKVVLFALSVAIYTYVFRMEIWEVNHLGKTLVRFLSMFMMVGFLYSGWKTSFTTAIYNSIWAVVLWQLLSEAWTAIELMQYDFFLENPGMIIVGMLTLYMGSYTLVAKTIGKWMPIDRKESIGPRQTLSALLIFVIIEVLANSEELRHISEYSSEWKFLYISQLLCVVILYLQNEMFKKSAMKEELATMNMLWKHKQEQYELSKENIALINQKSHDLKHQIRALRKLNREEFDKYLDEIEGSVEIYESIVKTGNDVFDTILTEKSLYCQKREIKITCVADGSQMDFINAIDLYAILGNALDNAIEAVEKLKEPEKRQVDVMIYRQQNFLVMNFINPLQDKIVFEDEFPVTTKGDRRYHGFGLRSIFHFVKKYDGYMNVSEEDGCFSLKIMMPIP